MRTRRRVERMTPQPISYFLTVLIGVGGHAGQNGIRPGTTLRDGDGDARERSFPAKLCKAVAIRICRMRETKSRNHPRRDSMACSGNPLNVETSLSDRLGHHPFIYSSRALRLASSIWAINSRRCSAYWAFALPPSSSFCWIL